ncbi:hypothetical protein A2U01_0091902, partial [Trifolium medium]|nr:hypothetical protein [Trifolium medium]
ISLGEIKRQPATRHLNIPRFSYRKRPKTIRNPKVPSFSDRKRPPSLQGSLGELAMFLRANWRFNHQIIPKLIFS